MHKRLIDRVEKKRLQALIQSACRRKIEYKTKTEARRAMDATLNTSSKPLHIYPCPHCEGFHVGHVRENKRYKDG